MRKAELEERFRDRRGEIAAIKKHEEKIKAIVQKGLEANGLIQKNICAYWQTIETANGDRLKTLSRRSLELLARYFKNDIKWDSSAPPSGYEQKVAPLIEKLVKDPERKNNLKKRLALAKQNKSPIKAVYEVVCALWISFPRIEMQARDGKKKESTLLHLRLMSLLVHFILEWHHKSETYPEMLAEADTYVEKPAEFAFPPEQVPVKEGILKELSKVLKPKTSRAQGGGSSEHIRLQGGGNWNMPWDGLSEEEVKQIRDARLQTFSEALDQRVSGTPLTAEQVEGMKALIKARLEYDYRVCPDASHLVDYWAVMPMEKVARIAKITWPTLFYFTKETDQENSLKARVQRVDLLYGTEFLQVTLEVDGLPVHLPLIKKGRLNNCFYNPAPNFTAQARAMAVVSINRVILFPLGHRDSPKNLEKLINMIILSTGFVLYGEDATDGSKKQLALQMTAKDEEKNKPITADSMLTKAIFNDTRVAAYHVSKIHQLRRKKQEALIQMIRKETFKASYKGKSVTKQISEGVLRYNEKVLWVLSYDPDMIRAKFLAELEKVGTVVTPSQEDFAQALKKTPSLVRAQDYQEEKDKILQLLQEETKEDRKTELEDYRTTPNPLKKLTIWNHQGICSFISAIHGLSASFFFPRMIEYSTQFGAADLRELLWGPEMDEFLQANRVRAIMAEIGSRFGPHGGGQPQAWVTALINCLNPRESARVTIQDLEIKKIKELRGKLMLSETSFLHIAVFKDNIKKFRQKDIPRVSSNGLKLVAIGHGRYQGFHAVVTTFEEGKQFVISDHTKVEKKAGDNTYRNATFIIFEKVFD